VSCLLYFVPVPQQGAAEAELRAAGAAHAVDGGANYAQETAGPAGPGYLVGRDAASLLYDPDRQTWEKAPVLVEGYAGPGYWVGFDTASPPGPADLAREKQLDGHWVELGDRHRWLVPVARMRSGVANVPRRVRLGAGGEKTLTIVPAYEALWAEACAFWGEWIAALDPDVPAAGEFTWVGRSKAGAVATRLDRCFDLTCTALAVNYRVGPPEISLLGLVDSENAADAPLALCDWPSVEALAKKAGASGAESTSPGAGA